MAKNSGPNSKKAQRRLRANARKAEFDALTDEQKKVRMAENKQKYAQR